MFFFPNMSAPIKPLYVKWGKVIAEPKELRCLEDASLSSNKLSKVMKKRKRESVKFEDYVYSNLRRKFPASLGWNIEQERSLKDESRADYCLWRVKYGKKERAVAEVKNVTNLTINHTNQLDHYARKYHASYRLIHIPSKTHVDNSVREYADELGIEIVRLRYPRKTPVDFWSSLFRL